MASRSLDDLHPELKPLAEWFVEECKKQGIDVLIYCTWRSNQEQRELYEYGRTKPGPKRTDRAPGKSAHNFTLPGGKPASKAFDCCPVVAGKAIWNGEDPLYQRMGEIGESVGLEWAGRWKSFKEKVHFQIKE